MRNYLKHTLSAIMISSIVITAVPYNVLADGATPEQVTAAIEQTRYPSVVNGPVQAKIKSVLNEHTPTGSRIGAVVKMYNVSGDTVRVPDYEVRVTASDGASYTLRPSADNPVGVPSMSSVELSYMAQVDRAGDFDVKDIVWVDVNKDVYPKVETTMLQLPVWHLAWKGDQSSVTDPQASVAWGQSFTIPSVDSPIVFKTADLTTENKGQNQVYVLKLLAENPGTRSETIPAFTVNGKSDSNTYKGTRSDKVESLNPGEKKYLYFSIPADLGTKLNNFTLVTNEHFKASATADASQTVNYSIGRLNLQAPTNADQLPSTAANYTFGSPISFDPLNTIIDSKLDVSVADFELFENKGEGYQTGVVKFKISNKSDQPIPVPQFAAEMKGQDGSTYAGTAQSAAAGTAQTAAAQQVVPNTSYVVRYSFVLPLKDESSSFSLSLIDDKTAAPYKSTIASISVAPSKSEPSSTEMMLYPYKLNVSSFAISNMAQMGSTGRYSYTYKLKLSWDLQSTDQVISDAGFSKLLLEAENPLGQKIASNTFDLTGANKLNSGEQLIYFNDTQTDQLESPITVKVYETIDTPNGTARRLIGELKQ